MRRAAFRSLRALHSTSRALRICALWNIGKILHLRNHLWQACARLAATLCHQDGRAAAFVRLRGGIRAAARQYSCGCAAASVRLRGGIRAAARRHSCGCKAAFMRLRGAQISHKILCGRAARKSAT